MGADIKIQRFSGGDVARFIPDVARLRIEVFREYPYLYDGDLEYEAKYLRTYTASPDSVIVIALDKTQVIGASTAIPLTHETNEIKHPFLEKGINPDNVFYLGESVLQKNYRGRGLGVRFFEEREAHAANIGNFDWHAFCAVEREEDHPRRPAGYVALDGFWKKRGYQKTTDLRTTLSWKDLDESAATAKPMAFWVKSVK